MYAALPGRVARSLTFVGLPITFTWYNYSMPTKSRKSSGPAPDFSSVPEFARAIQHLAHLPKAELDAAIAKERAAKQLSRQNKQ